MAPYVPAVADLPPCNSLLLLALRWEGCGEQEDYVCQRRESYIGGQGGEGFVPEQGREWALMEFEAFGSEAFDVVCHSLIPWGKWVFAVRSRSQGKRPDAHSLALSFDSHLPTAYNSDAQLHWVLDRSDCEEGRLPSAVQ